MLAGLYYCLCVCVCVCSRMQVCDCARSFVGWIVRFVRLHASAYTHLPLHKESETEARDKGVRRAGRNDPAHFPKPQTCPKPYTPQLNPTPELNHKCNKH